MLNTYGSGLWPMTRAISIAQFLMRELGNALRANDPDAFPGSLFEWIRELGVEEVEELVLY